MRFLWLLLILKATNAANNESTAKDFLDPSDLEDNALLWKNLFLKLNSVLSETEKLNKRFDDLSKRQADQEILLTKLMENANTSRVDARHCQQWTTILRRQDASVDFNRSWYEYKIGFGDPHASFFIGLERLHALTTYGSPQELLIVLIDFENQTRYAKYDIFRIGSEAENYALTELRGFSGDSGDAMTYHKGKSFTTFDRDNNRGKIRDCAQNFRGGWWFHDPCYIGNLSGPYRSQNASSTFGVSWDPWRGWNYSLKYAEMMIRPKL